MTEEEKQPERTLYSYTGTQNQTQPAACAKCGRRAPKIGPLFRSHSFEDVKQPGECLEWRCAWCQAPSFTPCADAGLDQPPARFEIVRGLMDGDTIIARLVIRDPLAAIGRKLNVRIEWPTLKTTTTQEP